MHEAHHTSGEESGKYLEGEGVGGGICIFRVKIKDLVQLWGNLLSIVYPKFKKKI